MTEQFSFRFLFLNLRGNLILYHVAYAFVASEHQAKYYASDPLRACVYIL